MLKKIVKRLALAFGALLFLIFLAFGVIYFRINSRMNKKYDVAAEPITIRYDSAALASGERLVGIRACRECHGSDLGGNVLVDDFPVGTFTVKNLTRGKGGLPVDFGVEDWVLAIKHGLRKDGTPLRLMPSHELCEMSESDVADIIAYCMQVPNVDRELPSFRIGPLAYVLTEFDQIPLLPAENTDHNKPFAGTIKPDITKEYGQYLSVMCINCHGKNYKGGKSPIPGGKDRPDITSGGNPGKWSQEQFMHALQTGETPEGKKMNPGDMPWTITKNYNESELKALHLYLKSLP